MSFLPLYLLSCLAASPEDTAIERYSITLEPEAPTSLDDIICTGLLNDGHLSPHEDPEQSYMLKWKVVSNDVWEVTSNETIYLSSPCDTTFIDSAIRKVLSADFTAPGDRVTCTLLDSQHYLTGYCDESSHSYRLVLAEKGVIIKE